MFNDKYGLTQAVLEGRKTQTRRTFLKPGEDPLLHGITPEYLISVRSRYSLGETIAIAQKYEDFIVFVVKTECLWSASNTRKDATIRCLSVRT